MGSVAGGAKKPRLLIILNRFVIGGQAVDTIPLAHALKEFFEILIVYGEKEKDEIEPGYLLQKYPGLRLKKISQLRRSINPFIDIIAFVRLLVTISRFGADIVHTHGAKSGFLGRLAAFLSGVPVIIHTFHGHFFHSYFSSFISRVVVWVERVVGHITTASVALSTAQKHDLANVYKLLPPGKVHVIPLGFAYVSTIPLVQLRRQFRDTYGLTDGDVAVGIVGRIVPVKNHLFFNKVVQEYLSRYPQSRAAFFVIGDGDIKQNLQEDLHRRNVSHSSGKVTKDHRVIFTSWLQEMDEVMTGLDVIVLTSFNEGTPLSLIEAQYFRRPVICTDVGGVKDTMVDGSTGFLVQENEIAGFVEKLHLLVENDQLRATMGEAAHQFVVRKYSKENEVNMTKDFYFSLLHQKKII